MPRGLLQEAVCHEQGEGTASARCRELPGLAPSRLKSRTSFEADSSQLPAPRMRRAGGAELYTRGSGRVRAQSMRVAFGDFLNGPQFVPEPQDLQQDGLPDLSSFGRDGPLSGGSGKWLDIPGTNLQMELPSLPTPPSQLMDSSLADPSQPSDLGQTPGLGPGPGPDDSNDPGNVIEYFAIDGSGGGHADQAHHGDHSGASSGHHESAPSSPPEHHQDRHEESRDEPRDESRGDDHDQQADDQPVENDPPIVIDLSKKDHGLQPSVIAGGVLALFAQAYLWGNVFVTLFKPTRRPEQPNATAGTDGGNRGAEGESSAAQTNAVASPPQVPGNSAGGALQGTGASGNIGGAASPAAPHFGAPGSSTSAPAVGHRLDGTPVPVTAS